MSAERTTTARVALSECSVRVGEDEVQYLEAGSGPVVVFLHGWGLDHQAYRRVIRRIAQQGRRVLAPALPGFGGTEGLSGEDHSFGGYAQWIDRFLGAVGVAERVTVIGHSFGGGCAIQFAHDHPERIAAVVLVNSIGGSAWSDRGTVRAMSERPLWDWGLHFPGDVWPIRQATRVLPVIARDAITNLVRDPRAYLRVAGLARRADLRPQLEELRRRKVPVTVLWGNRDGIVPKESFEAMCAALGTTGTVVEGSHSWLLAHPTTFGELITNDLDVAALATGQPPRADV